ncbi:lysophospholipid acyltransferase family protein [Lacimicrobium alkaliphilum]|uniref:Acyltransferase n=1 Tax=Lacimicrobium alkaliphilum TaxID=1526571 RepID=A0A0U2Z8E4_9ALTE|nr:lysophospholipid acyltransferase family protein [Lacimicrobium alkaliphilum]ALS98708.1 acyltransferase [Lacimicrobium alkaliphilum]
MNNKLTIQQPGPLVPRKGNAFSRWLGRSVLGVMGWKLDGEFPNLSRFVACVAPHTSNWDFVIGLATVFALGLKVSFLGKHSLFIGPFGWWLRHMGGIAVDRRASHGVVQQVCERIAAEPTILAVAPEGTRKKVKRWKTGFLNIARNSDIPVLLIYFDYKHKVIGFGPLHKIGDDIDAEMAKIRAFYANIYARHPEKA